jgi:ribonucleoside-diphosphate reductase alpha chain
MALRKPAPAPEYNSAEWFEAERNTLSQRPKEHDSFDIYSSPLVADIFKSKYAYGIETWDDLCSRVVSGIYVKDLSDIGSKNRDLAEVAMKNYLWMPGGRILAGAGTAKVVTLMNCYVNDRIEDSMEFIADALKHIMLTGQQGGGIGTDFSTLRPSGAILRRTGSVASGPLPFMDTWNSACSTVKSAGDRRGAMMATISDTHPDLLKFVTAKHEKGRLTNFNVSVLISDAFMGAIEEDEDWYLHFDVPPAFERPRKLIDLDWDEDETGLKQYVYAVHRARDLWDQILQSTYEYAEPGVIFIDRINDLNNLQYCEYIHCTNPCGEQPLPPHGTCNLGAVNLSRMVQKPFTDDAYFDFELLKTVARIGTRFLDNVIDVTNYPLPQQREEEIAKRRLGLGVAGLGDAFAQMGTRYGSVRSFQLAEQIIQTLCITAYETSVELSIERDPFPKFSAEQFFEGFAGTMLPHTLQDRIRERGLRNGVLLTVAPTGTTSIAYGNIDGGLEPTFAHEMQRNVLQGDGSYKPYTEYSYAAKLWHSLHPDDELPRHMNTAEDVAIHEHIRMQEVCQKWIDASISKTINLPKETTFEEFRNVYSLAYDAGCKGCTTYRPSDVRGAILSRAGETPDETPHQENGTNGNGSRERSEMLVGRTIKLRWPNLNSALYLTINYLPDGTPWEIFFNSKDQRSMEWTTTTSLLMSLVLRYGFTLEDLAKELKQLSSLEGAWAEGQYYPSLVAYIGSKLEQMTPPFDPLYQPATEPPEHKVVPLSPSKPRLIDMDFSAVEARILAAMVQQCPKCYEYKYVSESGCMICKGCGYSTCQ